MRKHPETDIIKICFEGTCQNRGNEKISLYSEGVNAIRYLYKPYHPWRHGYRREKIKKTAVKTARILLLLELLWLVYSYMGSGMTEKTRLITDLEVGNSGESDSETEGEIYGIGIEKETGNLFWFHKEVLRKP